MLKDVTVVREWENLLFQMKCHYRPQVLIEPFEKWALDFVGPINPPSKQKRYI
jgi:hypothetical protein